MEIPSPSKYSQLIYPQHCEYACPISISSIVLSARVLDSLSTLTGGEERVLRGEPF